MSKYELTAEQAAPWRRRTEDEARTALPGEDIVIAGCMRRGAFSSQYAAVAS
jgi:hypothetical protein